MFARDAVKPAFAAAGDREIHRVDGEQSAIHQDPFIEPVRERQAHATALLRFAVDVVGPGFDPAELPLLLALRHSDVGDDGGGLKPAKGFAQQLVLVAAGEPPDRFQQVVGLEGQCARQVVLALLAQAVHVRRGPDQDVGVPDGRHAELGVRKYVHEHFAVRADILDGL